MLVESAPPRSSVESTTTRALIETQKPTMYRRLETAIRSFWTLKDLTAEQVDNFMKSYVIYDLDWKDEKMMVETLGPDYQKKVGECLRDYYSVLNHLCAIGELEKMYVPPIMDMNANLVFNQILYEESVAEELQLPENPRLFDLGCGRGRVAAHMAKMTGARVTGLNIDYDQVNSAIAFNQAENLTNDFIRRDMNDLPLPLPDEEFDGFYQIQAFSLCKDIPAMCKELHRVLKPGARLSLLDWVTLPDFNPEDPHHRELLRKIKPLIGAVGTPTPESLKKDLESAGFKVIKMDNPSIDGLQAPLIERADRYFATAKWATMTLVNWGILPAHFRTLFNRFTQDGEAFIEADRSRLITTCYHWLAVKPKEDEPLETGDLTAAVSEPQHTEIQHKSDSSENSDQETEASTSSSDAELKSPSPANTDSTGLTTPSISSPHPEKSDPLHDLGAPQPHAAQS